MTATTLSITTRLTEMSSRLIDAAAIAKAAVTCAESGSEHEAMRIAIDIDELLHEVTALHGAMMMFGRIQRGQSGGATCEK